MRICKAQKHVNCLINTWILPVKTWLLIVCDTAFYNSGLSILLHGVISLLEATSL